LNVENDDFSVGLIGTVLYFKSNVLEKLGIPQRLKIAAHRLFVIGVTRTRENASEQRIPLNAAISNEFYALDDVLLSPGCLLRQCEQRFGE
jgi:hypothetical protein